MPGALLRSGEPLRADARFRGSLKPARDWPDVPAAFIAVMLLCIGRLRTVGRLTASGLLAAYRSGMRVWIGEGVNRARTLLIGHADRGVYRRVLVPLFGLASDSPP